MMPDVFAVTVAAISVVGGAVGRAPAAARRLPPGADNIRDLLVLDIAAVVTWALGIDPGGVSRGGGPAIHGRSVVRAANAGVAGASALAVRVRLSHRQCTHS
jgi:hypothetical protein